MKNSDKKNFKKVKINENDGLNISYDYKEIKKFLPHLHKEIASKEKILTMDSVKFEEQKENLSSSDITSVPNELINPGAIDFIRRCTSKEQAVEILDFLLKRKEISRENYDTLVSKVEKDNGLERLIKEEGGLKEPGYYLKKYYRKPNKNTTIEKNKI